MATEKVIIVDDDRALLDSFRRQYRSRFNLMTEESGYDVLKHPFDKEPVAVIVVDMRMPGMDGIELLKQVKSLSPLTTRIMLTGNADQMTAQNAINEGNIFRFYCKPCPQEVLAMGIEDGIAEHVRLVNQEETQRRRTENEVKARTRDLKNEVVAQEKISAELQAILDNMTETVYRTDIDGVITLVSRSVKSLTGYDPDEVLGKDLGDYYVEPAKRDDFLAILRDMGGQIQNHEIPLRHKEGHTVWVSVNAHFIYDDDRKLLGVEGTARDITRRKDTETKLAENTRELEFQKFAMDQHAIVSVTDAEGTITYVNDRFCHISGYLREELIGQNHRILKSGEHQPPFFQEQWTRLSKGQVWSGQMKNRRKNGSHFWVEATLIPFLDDNARPYQFYGVQTDITEQKETEARLVKSEEAMRAARKAADDADFRLTTALNSIEDGFALFDSQDRFVLCNHVCKNIFRNSADTLVPGTPFEEIVRTQAEQGDIAQADGRVEEWVTEQMAVRQSGKPYRELELSDGRRFRVATHPTPDGGKVTFMTDITELWKSNQALKESEAKLRDYAETSADWYWDMDADLRFSAYSGNIARYALDPSQLIGKQRWDLADADLTTEHWRRHKADLEDRRPFKDFEYSLKRPDGQWIHVSVSGKPVFDDDGIFQGYRGTTKDISTIRHLKENLETALNHAEAANQAKSGFLASMSHEIRTPMAGVMGFADMLMEDDMPPESMEKVYQIRESTQSLLSILNGILDISKLEAGKMEIETLDFHLPSLLDGAVDMFHEKNEADHRRNLTISSELSDDLPENIQSDPTRLRQILLNLMGNAVKFTEAGGVTLKADMIRDNSADMLRFQVADTGIGLKPEHIEKLFTDYTQAEASTSRHYQGTGLGLSICKQLVNLMGGEIAVESTPDVGSTFWFTLPYVRAETDPETEGGRKEVKFAGRRKLRILAAEDNGLNQRIIMAIMTAYGHDVEITENGALAVEAQRTGDYDLILMDIRMPEMNGPDAAREIRRMSGDKGKIPIIALTADAMTENRHAYFEAGMNEIVTKPIDRAELLGAINTVMGEDIHVVVENVDGSSG